MLSRQICTCPYCGESFKTTVDLSGGTQSYVEDCYVCCRPIEFHVEVDLSGELTSIQFLSDDE